MIATILLILSIYIIIALMYVFFPNIVTQCTHIIGVVAIVSSALLFVLLFFPLAMAIELIKKIKVDSGSK